MLRILSSGTGLLTAPRVLCRLRFDINTTSGWTMAAVLEYLEQWKPSLVILENVQRIDHRRKAERGESSAQILRSKVEALGYDGSYEAVNTLEYGLPQSRRRMWFMFSKVCGAKRPCVSQAFANMHALRTDNAVPLKSLLAASESKGMAKRVLRRKAGPQELKWHKELATHLGWYNIAEQTFTRELEKVKRNLVSMGCLCFHVGLWWALGVLQDVVEVPTCTCTCLALLYF